MLEMVDKVDEFERIRKEEYESLLKVKSLLPEEVWSRYSMFDLRDVPESVMLRKAQSELRKAFLKAIPNESYNERDEKGAFKPRPRSEERQSNVDSSQHG